MAELLSRIEVPNILLWFSQRPPSLQLGDENVARFMGDFPHFVTAPMVSALESKADRLVEVVTRAGLPNRLADRDNGEPVPIFEGEETPDLNAYYPSPLMHEAAAEALEEPLAAVLARRAPVCS